METNECSSSAEVLEVLKRQNVIFGVDISEVDTWLSSDNSDDLVVARGSYPKNGKDGYIKLLVDVSAKPQFMPEPAAGGKGIDYRSAMRVALVQADEKIAEVVLPTTGEKGSNVLGGIMAALPGNSVRFAVGDGVEQKGNDLVAKVAGTPNSRDNVISVRKMYEIQGDVSFETGNINFPGTVIIKGDVLDDFEITAQEHVIVQGAINGAKITAGGYIQCLGGVFGKKKAELRANAFIEARFCDSATLACDGDITITKDLLHCRTQCLGTLKCGGSIIGGEAMALKGIEAAEIGSDMGARTIVSIRKHYRQEKAKELISELLTEANQIYDHYKRLIQIPQLETDDIQGLEKDIKAVAGIIQKKKSLDTQIDRFEKILGEQKAAAIRVLKVLWSDVVLTAPYCKFAPLEKTAGPLSAREDVAHGSMVIQHG